MFVQKKRRLRAIILAVNSDLIENVKLLCGQGEPELSPPDGYTALASAKENGNKDIVGLLENAGAK